MIPTTLETERLTLRPATLNDARSIYDSYAQDPQVTRFLCWRPHQSIQETRSHLKQTIEAVEKGEHFYWLIENKATNVLGAICLRPDGVKADIGYCLGQHAWGKGYMTEATKAVVDVAIAEPQYQRVWATCAVDNVESARVLEKSGMKKEGLLKRWAVLINLGETAQDMFCYAKTR